MSQNLERVRNIGIAAHVDAGKTTLTERILFYTGANHRIGEVHDATAHMDYMPEEREHGITITTAVTRCPWNDHFIQVVDTPGHIDFTIEVERSMRVLDGAVIVMDGVRGVEPQTETVWRQASRFEIPRMIFINKMDKPGADFERAMESVSEKLRGNPIPVCLPLDDKSIINLIDQTWIQFSGEHGEKVSVSPVPEEHQDLLELHRENTILGVADHNETIEEMVLMEEDIDAETLWEAVRSATIEGKIHPVFGGSALRNWGVQPLLDGVLKILPSPLDRPPAIAKDKEGNEELIEMDAQGPVIALAFKVQLWDGRRHVFARIYSGVLRPGDKIKIAGKNTEERIARVFDVDANSKTRKTEAVAGEIVLLAGLRHATTGDTLCKGKEFFLESIDAKSPVLGLAVETESTKDEAKMLEAIAKVCEEDPTVIFEEDEDTGQRILRGMGELHLQIIFERLQREFNLKLRAGKPRVTVRETIRRKGSADVLLDRTLKAGEKEILLKARAVATAKPNGRGEGVSWEAKPTLLPNGIKLKADQLQAIEMGVQDSLMGGPIEGAPLEDVMVSLDTVEIYEKYSTPQALRIVCAQAVRNALVDANGVKLQPIMKIEVNAPDEYVGAVLGDLQSRNAVITGQDPQMGVTAMIGECSLEKMLGYMSKLRSITKGRGSFTMEFSRFDAF